MDSSTSDHPAVDSAAKLLQDLHLVGRNRHGKHMDTREMDLLLEVPDTPDRKATTCPVEEIGEEAARITYRQQSSNFGREGISSSNAFDNESLFRKARLASLISEPCDAGLRHVEKKFPFAISYPTRRRSDRRKVARDLCGENETSCSDYLKSEVLSPGGPIKRTHNGFTDPLELSDDGRGKGMNEYAVTSGVSGHCSTNWTAESNCDANRTSSVSKAQAMAEKAASEPYPRRFERRRRVCNGLISPNSVKDKFPLVHGELSASSVARSALDKGKGIDLSNNSQNKSERILFQQHKFNTPQKNCGQRKLVRNGCISPLNIAKSSDLSDWKKEGIERLDSHEVQDGFSLLQLHLFSPDSESRQADEMKEKVFLNDGTQVNGQDAKSSFMSTSSISDSQAMAEKAASKPYPRRFERRRLVRNGLISPSSIKDKLHLVHGESSASSVGKSVLDKGKGVDLSNNSQNKSEHTLFQQHQFDILQKNSGQRMLVQNGCTSLLNIAKNNDLTDWKEGIERLDSHEFQDGFSLFSPDSEPRQADEMKEKVYLNDGMQLNDQDAKSSFMSSRELLLPGKETMISSEAFADRWPTDDIGSKTTHDHSGKAAQLTFQEPSVVSNGKDESCDSFNQHCESVFEGTSVNMICPRHATGSLEAAGSCSCTHNSNLSRVQGTTEINFARNADSERHCRAERLTKGKRKSSSSHTLLGECSSAAYSAFTESEMLHPQSYGEISSTKSTRGRSSQCHGVRVGPIIDVDELPSPLLRNTGGRDESSISSEESAARALQVESDEMLARQLQEQFFSESPNFGGEEQIDATIAWALQQEEDSQHASLIRSRGQSLPRSPTLAHLYRQYPRESSLNSSVRSTSRARIASSARITQLRRNTRRAMDLETRLNFLEALEVAFNNGGDLRSNILQVQRDFNENDYEMLLALDDDNQHVGASHHQINSLPQSVIQNDNVEEACAICLEKPSFGETIRHLPCLHKFHKDCIDRWLRRRTSCPICKSDIT